jgi:ribonuclease HI
MVTVFTDGSCKGNGKVFANGGIGVFFPEKKEWSYSEKVTFDSFKTKVTNNLTELYAIQKAIEIAVSHDITDLLIYTDSMYCFKTFTTWAKKWQQDNWKKSDGKPILNKKLIQEIYELVKKYNIKFQHCNSHLPEPKNKDTEEYYIWYSNTIVDKYATNC